MRVTCYLVAVTVVQIIHAKRGIVLPSLVKLKLKIVLLVLDKDVSNEVSFHPFVCGYTLAKFNAAKGA